MTMAGRVALYSFQGGGTMREKRSKQRHRKGQRDSSWIAELFEALGDIVGDVIEALLK